MNLYVSGPMTGRPDFNYPAFNAMAAKLRLAGHTVFNPAENFGGDTSRARAEYMRLDIQMVLMAEAVVVLDGWEHSRGARLEVAIARELGIDVLNEFLMPVVGDVPLAA